MGWKILRNWDHSVQEVVANENTEIRVDTRIKIQHNIFIFRDEATLIEIGITNFDKI